MLTKRVNEKSGTVLQEASTTSSREKSGKLEAQSSSFLLPRVSHQRTRSNSTSECLVAGPPGGGRRLLGVTCAVTCASLPLRVWNACRSGTARAGSESFLCPRFPHSRGCPPQDQLRRLRALLRSENTRPLFQN